MEVSSQEVRKKCESKMLVSATLTRWSSTHLSVSLRGKKGGAWQTPALSGLRGKQFQVLLRKPAVKEMSLASSLLLGGVHPFLEAKEQFSQEPKQS